MKQALKKILDLGAIIINISNVAVLLLL